MKVVIMEGLGISAQELAQRKKPFEDRGVVFEEFARTTDTARLMEQGLLVLTAGRALRLLPPLTIRREEIDKGLTILEQALA